MRYRLAAASGYLAVCLSVIYSTTSSGDSTARWSLIAAALLQPAFGALVGKWWAVPLPLALIPLSVPAGYGDGELPVWFGVLFLAGAAVPLVLFGVVARKLGSYHLRRNGSGSTVVVAGAIVAAGFVVLALLLGQTGSNGNWIKGNSSVSDAASFRGFPVYYAGRTVNGYELSAVMRQPLGGLRGQDQVSVGFIYGTCDGGGEGCAPPVEISNEPACRRNLSMYTGGLGPTAHPIRFRGATGSFFEGGSRIEIQTGKTTVVIFAYSKEEARSVARHLRGVNVGISEFDPLPPPAPGALRGKVPCPR